MLVTADGLRWQEVFAGSDRALMNKENGGVAHPDALKQSFWHDTPDERREALLPFVWSTVGRQGQLFGNAEKGSVARVTNGKNFSYPGYNEILTGGADPRVDSNAKRPNPNKNVLEWLNAQPQFAGRIAAFGSWDVFPFILNRQRSGLFVNAGWEPIPGADLSPREEFLNRLMLDTYHYWEDSRYDSFTHHAALEHFKKHAPRVLYVAFGETDEFAHQGRYDLYLHAAHEVDSYLKEIWEEIQAQPAYRDKTTLIVTTDHGRGDAPVAWKSHGARVDGSEKIWIAVLGPDTPPLGERKDVDDVTQSQVAATVAALLGLDYAAASPQAAKSIEAVLAKRH